MGISDSGKKIAYRFAWMAICGGLGIMFFLRGEIAMGFGLISGTAAGSIAELIRLRKRKIVTARGDVLYDERDIQVAGHAAIMTIRITMFLLGIAILAVVAADMYWGPPILPVLGILMGIVSLSYSVIYRILRKRDGG